MDKPNSPSDPRPNNEPYYIEKECPYCGTELVLYSKHEDPDIPEEAVWHDEWTCPNPECPTNQEQDKPSIFMDWPKEYAEKILDTEGV